MVEELFLVILESYILAAEELSNRILSSRSPIHLQAVNWSGSKVISPPDQLPTPASPSAALRSAWPIQLTRIEGLEEDMGGFIGDGFSKPIG